MTQMRRDLIVFSDHWLLMYLRATRTGLWITPAPQPGLATVRPIRCVVATFRLRRP